MVEAIWTGQYPCLCHGEWILKVDGVDVSHLIPEDRRTGHMNTRGTYQEWRFGDDWEEIWEDYEDGLEYNEWIAENEWVRELPADPYDVYVAFSAEDWRHGSCGGCI